MAQPLRIAPLRIALAGLGTVGGGVIRLIETNGALIARRAGRAEAGQGDAKWIGHEVPQECVRAGR